MEEYLLDVSGKIRLIKGDKINLSEKNNPVRNYLRLLAITMHEVDDNQELYIKSMDPDYEPYTMLSLIKDGLRAKAIPRAERKAWQKLVLKHAGSAEYLLALRYNFILGMALNKLTRGDIQPITVDVGNLTKKRFLHRISKDEWQPKLEYLNDEELEEGSRCLSVAVSKMLDFFNEMESSKLGFMFYRVPILENIYRNIRIPAPPDPRSERGRAITELAESVNALQERLK